MEIKLTRLFILLSSVLILSSFINVEPKAPNKNNFDIKISIDAEFLKNNDLQLKNYLKNKSVTNFYKLPNIKKINKR